MKSLKVKIPATTSNLGPGYDCLGLALALYNRARVTWDEPQLLHSPERLKKWAESLPFETRAVGRAYGFYADHKQIELPLADLDFGGDIPVARGLGSSATCALAGLAAASYIHQGSLDKKDLLDLATAIEGHPDNAAPALFGGLVLSQKLDSQVVFTRLDWHKSVQVLLLIPDFELATQASRSVLPQSLPHADAVRQTAAFGFLLSGLARGLPQDLSLGNRDFLHQPYRQALIPGYSLAEAILREAGCSAVALSGAGPSLAGFLIGSNEEALLAQDRIRKSLPSGWRVQGLPVDFSGMTIEMETCM